MLRFVGCFVLFAMASLVPHQAAAVLVSVSWVSESDLKTKCAENGGDWSSSATGYSCGKKCAGNDYCVYGCSKGQEHNSCNASVPRQVPKGTRLSGAAAIGNVLNFAGPADAPAGAGK